MEIASIEVVLSIEPDYAGSWDSVRIRINSDGHVDVIRFCSGEEDAFTERPSEMHLNMDVRGYFGSLCDEGPQCQLTYENGNVAVGHIPEDVIQGLKDVLPDVGRIFKQIVPEDILKKMFDDGTIDEARYLSGLKDHDEYRTRKEFVDRTMSDGSYPFVRGDADIAEDHRFRLISDPDYEMFVWYRRNRPKNCPSGTEKSFKLKLSCEGLRIMGRYDLCEYHMNRDSNEMTKRLYCFRGTLFEGCGNVKAPDDATYIEMSDSRRERAFQYLNELRHMDILDRDYRDSPFSSFFFDLYTRYEDAPMMHTKGTAEYPYFIKLLMFAIGAENIY